MKRRSRRIVERGKTRRRSVRLHEQRGGEPEFRELPLRKRKRQRVERKFESPSSAAKQIVEEESKKRPLRPLTPVAKEKRDFTFIEEMKVREFRELLRDTNGEYLGQFSFILNRLNGPNIRLISELENTCCLHPCLDFLTARDLANLSCCSKHYKRKVEVITNQRIEKVIGRYSLQSDSRVRPIVPYVKGQKKNYTKNQALGLEEQAWTGAYLNMTVKALKALLKSRGLSTRGSKNGLVGKLKLYDEQQESAKRNLKYLWQREFLQPFYVDQWLDVQDTTNKWLEAQVIEVDNTSVAIHYKGWKRKYDEWLDLSHGSSDWDRIARPLSNFQNFPERSAHHRKFVEWLTMGYAYKFSEPVIMVHDTTEKWVEASVIGYRSWSPNCSQIKVTYHGWDNKYDEWIDVTSYRIAPRQNFPSMEAVAQMLGEEPRGEHLGTTAFGSGMLLTVDRPPSTRAAAPPST